MTPMATIHPQRHAFGPPIRAPTIKPVTENSIAYRPTCAPQAFSPTQFLHRLSDAETLNSFLVLPIHAVAEMHLFLAQTLQEMETKGIIKKFPSLNLVQ